MQLKKHILVLLVAIFFAATSAPATAQGETGDIVINIASEARESTPGTVTTLTTVTVPNELVGMECSVTVNAENNSSVHSGSNISVRSSGSVQLLDVERSAGVITHADGTLKLGSNIIVEFSSTSRVTSFGGSIIISCDQSEACDEEERCTSETSMAECVLPLAGSVVSITDPEGIPIHDWYSIPRDGSQHSIAIDGHFMRFILELSNGELVPVSLVPYHYVEFLDGSYAKGCLIDIPNASREGIVSEFWGTAPEPDC